MRILLQHQGTGHYLHEAKGWCADSAEAMDFVSSTAALEYCAAHSLAGVQLVLKFEQERYDIVLPLVPGMQSQAEAPRPTL